MIAELQKLGCRMDMVIGPSAPAFRGRARRPRPPARETLSGVPKDCPIIIDGLAFGVLPEAAKELSERNPLIALVHHPLALETGLAPVRRAGCSRPASTTRSRPRRACSSHQPVETSQLLIDDYDRSAWHHHPSPVPAPIPGAMAKGQAATGIGVCCRSDSVVPRKGL